MQISVVGAGAMGCIYGGTLSEAGHDVTLIDVWAEHVKALNEQGLKLTGVSGDRTIPVHAVTSPVGLPVQDLVIIFVKSAFTEAAIREVANLIGPETTVLTLQNGLGNAEKIGAIVGVEKVVAGVTSHGGTMLGPGQVRHAGRGETVLGELVGGLTPRLENLAAAFTAAGLETRAVESVDSLIWSKLLVNVGINAVTALLRVTNGELPKHEATRELVRLAVEEGARVAAAKGIKLIYPDPVANCLKVAELTGPNLSSMLQDVQAKRRTEVDVINGAVVDEGKKLGVAAPVNQTLRHLIKAIEECY
ncbi:ketopantoate reductase family protein [Gelria sp. Kuro-4]|uniref:ketopantoate reductase family protein n=1 Tax=Gelria sp. Kuro-4 TaxID=2796927 RepID=UPI001BEE35F5|nr:ketopantoate reductase family protein [Gelria sp. Kuro-4]BCV24869.1 2-dehydropantoate 2-reductase [Gelria sp. Kuro-4]